VRASSRVSQVLVPAPAPAFGIGADGYGLCSWKMQARLRFPGVDGTPWALSRLSQSLVFSPFLQDPKERPSVWVGKKGQNCPKASVSPLAVGCVEVRLFPGLSWTGAHLLCLCSPQGLWLFLPALWCLQARTALAFLILIHPLLQLLIVLHSQLE